MMNVIPIARPGGMMIAAPSYQYPQQSPIQATGTGMQAYQQQGYQQQGQLGSYSQGGYEQGRISGPELQNLIAQIVIQQLMQLIQKEQAGMGVEPTSLEALVARLGNQLIPRQQYTQENPCVTSLMSQGLGMPTTAPPTVYDPMNSMWGR